MKLKTTLACLQHPATNKLNPVFIHKTNIINRHFNIIPLLSYTASKNISDINLYTTVMNLPRALYVNINTLVVFFLLGESPASEFYVSEHTASSNYHNTAKVLNIGSAPLF